MDRFDIVQCKDCLQHYCIEVGHACVFEADEVNNPAHYNNGKVECIEYIRQQLGKEGFIAYCEGNVIKYGHRWRYKNGVQDLKKKLWYLEAMIKEVEKDVI